MLLILSVLFFGITGVFLGKKYQIKEKGEVVILVYSRVVPVIVGICFAVLLNMCIILFVIIPHLPEQPFEVRRMPLVALSEVENSNDTFFLISELLNHERYYAFYYYDKNGKRELLIANDEQVTINEQDGKDAYLLIEGKRKIFPEWVSLYICPKFIIGTSTIVVGKQKKYIYVPKGTVKLGYEFKFKE